MAKIIRTKTEAKGGITSEEKARMDEHAKLWIGRAMRTAPIEPEKIIPAIEGIYAAANLKKPRVVIVPSPLVMAFAYGASSALLYARKNATDAATHAATDAATYAATDAATYAATHAATYAATYAATDLKIFENGAAAACFDLAGILGLSCATRWDRAYQGGNMWAAWDSYLTACRDILGLELRSHEGYAAWEQAAIHGGFRVMHEDFCIVSDFPEVIRVDDEKRPHCENGPSHRWRDGWSLYHWHGTKIPAEWIEDRASLTPQIALTWPNVDQRSAACQILGWHQIINASNARVIDEDPDPQIGRLVEIDLPDHGKQKFIHAMCGTGREVAVMADRNAKTVIEAQAASYGLTAKDFRVPEVRT